jgi:hypothetical protein
MNKHRTHQIDDRAQLILRDLLPVTWVVNEQLKDYGKDFLVEIGETDGNLTGSNFFVQLKGQEKATKSRDGAWVKFYLETKYAKYYCDKVRDLPVFLIVVDISEKQGWWLFLQPILKKDRAWRAKKSMVINLPVSQQLCNTAALRAQVDKAKVWMRQHFPLAIHEVFDGAIASKNAISSIDPRFEASISVIGDQSVCVLHPKETVNLSFVLMKNSEHIRKKASDLFDKGAQVVFAPGELKITGSPLFKNTEQSGCSIQTLLSVDAVVSLVCCNSQGHELARLSEISGQIEGGFVEHSFSGDLRNSPFSLKIAPMGQSQVGTVQFKFDHKKWNQQHLSRIAYFDKLWQFFRVISLSASTVVECEVNGNRVFQASIALQAQSYISELCEFIEMISKIRRIAAHFKIDPVWDHREVDQDLREAADCLDVVLFHGEWSKPKPRLRLNLKIKPVDRRSLICAVEKEGDPSFIRIVSTMVYSILGVNIEVGRLIHVYKNVYVKRVGYKIKRRPLKKQTRKEKQLSKNANEDVELLVTGTPETVMIVRVATSEDE